MILNTKLTLQTFICLAMVLCLSCNTTKTPTTPVAPQESYLSEYNPLGKLSTIHIPVQANIRQIEKALNEEMDKILGSRDDLFEKDKKFNINVQKKDNFKLHVSDDTLLYSLPLDLLISQDLGFTTVQAKGAIDLFFATTYAIQSNWELTPQTDIKKYEWIDKPNLNFGGVQLNIENIANKFIERSEARFTQIIDQQIKENFVLKEYVQEAWTKIQSPFPLSIEKQLWAYMEPQQVSMSPLSQKDSTIHAQISIETRAFAQFGEKPAIDTLIPLPNYTSKQYNDDEFSIQLLANVPMDTLRALAAQEVEGKTFTSGKNKITIEELTVYGKDNKLLIETKVSGDYDGNFYLEGRPTYNEKKNRLELKNMDFEMETKKFIQKTMAWLFKKNIKSKIEKALSIPLRENLNEMKSILNKNMESYAITDGIILKGKLNSLHLEDTFIEKKQITIALVSKGTLTLHLKELELLNK